jgi:hypothetical protein
MSKIVHPPCEQILSVTAALEHMISRYLEALRSTPPIGRWEAPQEGATMSWLLIRNVEAVIELARLDEVLVTAAWCNARAAFELSARIIWMLQPDDPYQAECRWLAYLEEWEKVERNIANEAPGHAERHTQRAEAIRAIRERITAALPNDYQAARKPRFQELLTALNSAEMYQYYREGSQYVHGSMYASASYSKNLGSLRNFGEFTSAFDWILPLRLCWLSLREAARMVLRRLEAPARAMPNWKELNRDTDATFDALASYAIESGEFHA